MPTPGAANPSLRRTQARPSTFAILRSERKAALGAAGQRQRGGSAASGPNLRPPARVPVLSRFRLRSVRSFR